MSSEVRSSEDSRILQIVDAIYQLAAGNLETRGAPSDRRDDLDAIILGVNILAEEFSALQQETRRQVGRLAVVNEIGRAIASSLQMGMIFASIADAVERLIPFDRASVALLEESGETMIVFALRTAMRSELGPGLRLPITPSARAIAATRRGVLIPDLTQEVHDPTYQTLLREGFRATMAAPLIAGDRIVGVLNLGAREPGAFGGEHLSLLQTVADQIAPAIENARLHEQVQRHAEELERRVEERTAALRRSNYFNETLLQTIPFGMDIVDESGYILYLSPAMKTLAPAAAPGARCWDVYKDDRRQCADCPLLRGVEVGETRALETSGALGGKTFEISHTGVIFQDRKAVLEVFYDITERKQRERELEALAAVSAALRAAQTRAEMLPIILDQLAAVLKVGGAALVMRDPVSGETVVELARGELARALRERLPPGEGLSGHVIATGQPYLNTNVRTDARLTRPDLLGDICAVACAPLIAQEQTIGALWIGCDGDIAPGEVRLLAAIADMAANAIHRATLHEQVERRVRHLSALHSIDLAITASLDLSLTLNVLLDVVISQLDVDAAAVLTLEPATRTLVYAAGRGFRSNAVERTRVRVGSGHAGRAVLERRTVDVPDLREAVPASQRAQLWAAEGFVAHHAVPLIAKGEVQGVLEVFQRATVRRSAEWLDFIETLATQAAIAIDDARLFEGLQRSNLELSMAYDATLEGWARALELRDLETEGHTRRVIEITIRLAQAMGINGAQLVCVRRGALLHDIGKMGIPDSILLKAGPLSGGEWEIMRRHPIYAYEMLLPIAYLRPALDIPYCHHEKWDGTGYPRGLKGDEIPLAARIFAVADVYDALRSDRPYRKGWPEDTIWEYIREQAGKHFDPAVVEVFSRSDTG